MLPDVYMIVLQALVLVWIISKPFFTLVAIATCFSALLTAIKLVSVLWTKSITIFIALCAKEVINCLPLKHNKALAQLFIWREMVCVFVVE